MADTLVERVTGAATAGGVPVEVRLVMTDAALLAGAATPAQVPGYGPVPAGIARDLLTGRDEEDADNEDADEQDADEQRGEGNGQGRAARMWLRRLFTSPDGAHLVGMDSPAPVSWVAAADARATRPDLPHPMV